MKKNVNITMIGVAVVALIGFAYLMYRVTQPELQAPYDARNGPPAYATQGQGGAAPQAPGKAPAPAKP